MDGDRHRDGWRQRRLTETDRAGQRQIETVGNRQRQTETDGVGWRRMETDGE